MPFTRVVGTAGDYLTEERAAPTCDTGNRTQGLLECMILYTHQSRAHANRTYRYDHRGCSLRLRFFARHAQSRMEMTSEPLRYHVSVAANGPEAFHAFLCH